MRSVPGLDGRGLCGFGGALEVHLDDLRLGDGGRHGCEEEDVAVLKLVGLSCTGGRRRTLRVLFLAGPTTKKHGLESNK